MQAQFDDLSAQLVRLNRGLGSVPNEPPNPGFEPEPAKNLPLANRTDASVRSPVSPAGEPSVPRGWHRVGESTTTATVAIDRENPHSGEGSLRLSAMQSPASAVCEPFAPNVQSTMTVQAYFRASQPGSRVRVWIEGESGGRPYIRRTELDISTTWEVRAVRASDLPAAGLDSARLRFELEAPGFFGSTISTSSTNWPPSRCDSIPSTRCWLRFKPTAISVTPTSPGLPARTGSAKQSPRPSAAWPEPMIVCFQVVQAVRLRGKRLLPYRLSVRCGKIVRKSRLRIKGPIESEEPGAGQDEEGRMFVACSTLCFAREPLETALHQIAELEFDKFELALVEDGQHFRPSEVGDNPEAALQRLPGAESDSFIAPH